MIEYDKHFAAKLTRLAAAESSGMIPVTGPVSGAIHLRAGRVVFAECGSIPESVTGDQATGLSKAFADIESIVDAAFELLTVRSVSGRLRPTAPAESALSLKVEDLLDEVTRRRRLLRQMSGLTPDAAVARTGALAAERVQVSAAQWALLIRAERGATARGLAWALGRSVFGTTVEIYRLMCLGLLTVGPAGPRSPGGDGDRGDGTKAMGDNNQAPVSFTEALPIQKGQ